MSPQINTNGTDNEGLAKLAYSRGNEVSTENAVASGPLESVGLIRETTRRYPELSGY
jgi:hypothetical protein